MATTSSAPPLSEEAMRLMRARKTVIKMLKKRGYIVADDELTMTVEMFREPDRQLVDDRGRPNRGAHTMNVENKDDPDDTLFVFFPDDLKVGVKPIRLYCDRMKDENVKKAIMVVRDNLTPFAKQAVLEMRQQRYKIEYFREAELLVDITEHVLVPTHIVMKEAEKKTLLERYKLRPEQLPRIQESDPVARYYGLSRGQVVKIVRPSETAGRYVTYRICMG
eukprot:g2407.t1